MMCRQLVLLLMWTIQGLAMIFMGDQIFKMLGYAAVPPWYEWVKENKLQACMFLWIFNSVAAGQLATQVGALYWTVFLVSVSSSLF